MFAKRLYWLTFIMSLLAVGIIARLVDLQVVRAAEYDALTERMLTRPRIYLKASRGSVFDRGGRRLLSDEPAADIGIHFAILDDAARPQYLRQLARRLRRRGDYPPETETQDIVAELRKTVDDTWDRLAELTSIPRTELEQRGQRIYDRVKRIRAIVARRRGVDQPVAEENELHPLLENLDVQHALDVRMGLEEIPWLRVLPSSQRAAHRSDALVHVLGRLGEASAERIEADPLAESELRSLRAGDQVGITGIERLAETTLRGTRGRIIEDFDHVVLDRVEPIPGEDVYLTVDLPLQEHAYEILGRHVGESPNPAGGAAVVIDVDTREVLALVSYPSYSFRDFNEYYAEMRRDLRRTPLRFRAVANRYPPGSTCKAITLYGGLADGVVTPHERIHCTGHYLEHKPGIFRCWIYNQHQITHDAGNPTGQAAVDAIRNSCNIYFFELGDRLGPDRLCHWFQQFGFGRTQGSGLIEEHPGIVPTRAWLADNRPREPRPQPYDPWNWSIGQGEVNATPLQAANVAATIATNRWAPVVLARDGDGRPLGQRTDQRTALRDDVLRVLRSGMWRVVNERGGTGHAAELDHPGVELCGKTGSAQAVPRVTLWKYRLRFEDGRELLVTAPTAEDALAPYPEPKPEIATTPVSARRFPDWSPGEKLPAHAWFIGYTQRKGTPRGAAPRQGRKYAIAVLIEYGGSGDHVAGPAAKEILEWLLEHEPTRGLPSRDSQGANAPQPPAPRDGAAGDDARKREPTRAVG